MTWILFYYFISSAFLAISSSNLATFKFKSFTFIGTPPAFIQYQPNWSPEETQKIQFSFKTLQRHALLMYHTYTNYKTNYALTIQIQNGRLSYHHIYNKYNITRIVGRGLNHNVEHKVVVEKNIKTGNLSISVGDSSDSVILNSIPEKNSGIKVQDPVILFGGINTTLIPSPQITNYTIFLGCVSNVEFTSGSRALQTVIPTLKDVQRNCRNPCDTNNPCFFAHQCVNEYSHVSCDCFQSMMEGKLCQLPDVTTVSFRGYDSILYKMRESGERQSEPVTRIGLHFKTKMRDGLLLYAFGSHPRSTHVAFYITNTKVNFSISFGDAPIRDSLKGTIMNDDKWHNLTLYHKGKDILLVLDGRSLSLTTNGHHHTLHLDNIYLGAIEPRMQKLVAANITTDLKFAGCLKHVYVNRFNILEQFKVHKNSAVQYIGPDIEYGCTQATELGITFYSNNSFIQLNKTELPEFILKFSFRTQRSTVTLVGGEVETEYGKGHYELWLNNYTLTLDLYLNATEERRLTDSKQCSRGQWYSIEFEIKNGYLMFSRDFIHIGQIRYYRIKTTFNKVFLGRGALSSSHGFVGCMRRIHIQNEYKDPRSFVSTESAQNIKVDGCMIEEMCFTGKLCEHGGKCDADYVNPSCDCEGTGYVGKRCHFPIHKRSCAEYFWVGRKKSGIYLIDIDGSGPFPPTHVQCDINSEKNVISTRIRHNLEDNRRVRGSNMKSHRFNITYQGMTDKMLKYLVEYSSQCEQNISYSCRKAPLEFMARTYFRSAASSQVTSLGQNLNYGCPCYTSKCNSTRSNCQCDLNEDNELVDQGTYLSPQNVGIVEMVFVKSGEGHASISLGDLKCYSTESVGQVLAFATKESFIQLPPIAGGEIAFSFRTTEIDALLLDQRPNYALRIELVESFRIKFTFTTALGLRIISVTSKRNLISGEWQRLWVEYDRFQVKLTVNSDYIFYNMTEEERFGPFNESLFIAGTPLQMTGFIGCIKGLTIGGKPIDLYHYYQISPGIEGIISGKCQRSCQPENPCKNSGTCIEKWGSYKCICESSHSHSGINCEKDINIDAISFPNENSYLKFDPAPINMITSDIKLNFRTFEKEGLLFYCFDHLSNFLQLHFENGSNLVLTYNSLKTIVKKALRIPEMNDGKWRNVDISRKPEQTSMRVDNQMIEINKPLLKLTDHALMPWSNKDDETVRPSRLPVRPQTSFSILFIGGGDNELIRPKMKGLVGCLQVFRVGDLTLDLKAVVKNGSFVQEGCSTKCDQIPCKNGGICLYSWIKSNFRCDCSRSSFSGLTCDEENGASFYGADSITVHLKRPSPQKSEKFRITFSTTARNNGSRVLLYAGAYMEDTLIFMIDHDGYLVVEVNLQNVFERKTVAMRDFRDGYRHWIYYYRLDNDIVLFVDNINQSFRLSANSLTFHPASISLGGLPNQHAESKRYEMFVGCISNPLYSLEDHTQVLLFDTKTNPVIDRREGKIQPFQGKCGIITTELDTSVRDTTEVYEDLTLPPWNLVPPQSQPFEPPAPYELPDIDRAKAATVAIVMGILLLVVFTAIGCYMYCLRKSAKKQRKLRRRSENDYIALPNKNSLSNPRKSVELETRNLKDNEVVPENSPLMKTGIPNNSPLSNNVDNAPIQQTNPEISPNNQAKKAKRRKPLKRDVAVGRDSGEFIPLTPLLKEESPTDSPLVDSPSFISKNNNIADENDGIYDPQPSPPPSTWTNPEEHIRFIDEEEKLPPKRSPTLPPKRGKPIYT